MNQRRTPADRDDFTVDAGNGTLDVLRDLYVRGKYRDVILPMTVLRRLDAVLEATKDAVLEMKAP